MIPRFPRMSSAEVLRLLHHHGFIDQRQRGSHLILRHPKTGRRAVVPVGKKDLPIGTLRSILEEAGIAWES